MYASPVLYFEGVLTNQGPVSGNTSAFLDSVYTVHIAIKADVNLSQVRVNSTSGTELWSETFPYRFDNGHIYVELGRINPIPEDIFMRENLSFVLSIEGIDGEVSVPILEVPKAIKSGIANRAMSVDASGINGTIKGSSLIGVYSGISGVGPLSVTLNVVNDMRVGNALMVDSVRNRVGVGVSNPVEALEIGGNVRIRGGGVVFADGSTMNSAVQDTKIARGVQTSGNAVIEGDSGRTGQGTAVVRLGGADRITVLNGGVVGIGVSNPTQELDVN